MAGKKPGPNKGEGGRPLIVWDDADWRKFDLMCKCGVRQMDIAEAFGCSPDTIGAIVRREKQMSFSAYKDQKAGYARAEIMEKQMELALKGDRTMLIWLGKNLCGQSDKIATKQNVQFTGVQDKMRESLKDPDVRAAMNTLSDSLGFDLDDVELH